MAASQDFDGTSDKLEYNSATDGPATMGEYPISLGVWIYEPTGTGGDPAVIGHGDASTNRQTVLICRGTNDYRYRISWGTAVNVQGGTRLFDEWVHLAGVSASDSDHKLYVNGVEVATSTTTSSAGSSPDRWVVGNHAQNFNAPFDGKISDPVIYSKALSVEEVNEIMWNPLSIVDSIEWAPNLRKSGATVVGDYIDLSGNGYDCNVGNIPTADSSGPPVHFPQMIGT